MFYSHEFDIVAEHLVGNQSTCVASCQMYDTSLFQDTVNYKTKYKNIKNSFSLVFAHKFLLIDHSQGCGWLNIHSSIQITYSKKISKCMRDSNRISKHSNGTL